ncbi:MAG: nitroreductase family deazaflavin-dependent oxidoreductase [Nonomuraea sp.]|nr:nitroreductase family deazaflavin-dependent oxidoreductase [Nonomuraea sp.]NUP61055.1 nitroreductase family deazaflavin-dependent oxidoreductase [Nonomuraea sp.]NUP82582.1 nitroreductase family deazaflavin-dependent oxidoreductase [Nonomuraea sp.]NUS01337.1 nitroreductase family deazaflavin-dependent oxidoreductase [Nonomuraea sp.]
MLFGKEHVQRYQATDGAEGHDWNNTTVLLLTTKGRNSGKPYTTPLIYQRHGDAFLVVASHGGDPEHPQWYKNLVAHPEVEVQVKGDRFQARARTASDEEKPEMWRTMAKTWPDYDNYQQKTDRQIPVVVLERVR